MNINIECVFLVLVCICIWYLLNNKSNTETFENNNKDVCTIPNKNILKCISEITGKTGCIRCGIDFCNKNKEIPLSCYDKIKHDIVVNNNPLQQQQQQPQQQQQQQQLQQQQQQQQQPYLPYVENDMFEFDTNEKQFDLDMYYTNNILSNI